MGVILVFRDFVDVVAVQDYVAEAHAAVAACAVVVVVDYVAVEEYVVVACAAVAVVD